MLEIQAEESWKIWNNSSSKGLRFSSKWVNVVMNLEGTTIIIAKPCIVR